MNEMKVVITRIVSHFQLRLDEVHSVRLFPSVVLRSETDIKLILEPLV